MVIPASQARMSTLDMAEGGKCHSLFGIFDTPLLTTTTPSRVVILSFSRYRHLSFQPALLFGIGCPSFQSGLVRRFKPTTWLGDKKRGSIIAIYNSFAFNHAPVVTHRPTVKQPMALLPISKSPSRELRFPRPQDIKFPSRAVLRISSETVPDTIRSLPSSPSGAITQGVDIWSQSSSIISQPPSAIQSHSVLPSVSSMPRSKESEKKCVRPPFLSDYLLICR